MIKFFRHIRKAMIKENRTSKYLLYAIGEIVLVVIGILIALSINNWNEGKIEKGNEIALVEELLTNAKADSIFFNNRYFRISGQIKTYDLLIKHCKENTLDSLSKVQIDLLNEPFILLAHQSNLLSNNPNAYEQLTDKTLKVIVQKYIAQYDYVKVPFDLYNSVIKTHFFPIRIKFHKEIPETLKAKTFSEYSFLCDVSDNMGVVKLIRNYCVNIPSHLQSFLALNNDLIQTLTQYLAKIND